MTSSEVFASLFWIVAGGYVVYLGWTVRQIAANRSARRRHPSSLGPRTESDRPVGTAQQSKLAVAQTIPGGVPE